MGARWTPEEDVILTRIWKTPGLLKIQIDELPRRSVEKAMQRASKDLKLGPKTKPQSQVEIEVRALMADHRTRTVKEISQKLGRSNAQTRRWVKAITSAGDFYVVKWQASPTGGEMEAHYRFGNGKSVPKPKTMTSSERSKKFRRNADPIEHAFKRKRYTLTQKLKKSLPRDPLMEAFFGRVAA